MRNIRIGDYLVEQGLITQEQLEKVLEAQREAQGTKRFGDVIVELGFLSETKFTQALAGKLKVAYVDLSTVDIDEEAVRKVPEALALKHTVIAINIQGRRLTVATDDPINFNILEDIKVSTGMDTVPVLATKTAIKKMIGKHYSMQNVDSVLEGVSALNPVEDEDDDGSKDRVDSAPIVKLATTIVENSFRADATDIHIEPFKTYTRIRIRVNGDLVELMNVANQVHNSLTTRLKLISGMNIAEKRVPQDGRFTQVVDGTTLDVRVSSLPTVNGEKIVIRILSTGQIALRKITDLGMSDYNYRMFESMIKCPHGVMLVTGPTGSGKTTTLYAALGELAKPNVNVITVEDPVEKQIDGINQVQVNTKAGMTFAAALRSILRQDPDIVMIGEMRDSETAEIGIRAAITGHLVLSTLHTNDAASTIVRLVDMGIPPYMVASSLIGVIAQRLVKVLCPKCKTARMSTPDENKLMKLDHSVPIYEARGCPECNNTGYKGRTAIHEIIHCSAGISTLIADNASKEELEICAKKNGTKLLRENVSELVQQGVTSIDELVRVTYAV
ncbi:MULTISPECIES: GspE/PulE family protein [Ruminococcus]|uniref:GspE/PulE family protein n=1 Tax=Ruminococcus TaxID=1263 RepID=UPI00033FCC45|nr:MULTISPECIES: GspE/PulE family protein [Ruminococcus]MED9891631.1 ATPase, T2SS/T4P/T4SS family [Ruminococcus champanellensis]CDD54174.1 type II secretory pathway ATPase PulE/Tfp pilus assembly pathway ATPase PilB [Ruminococcus sp. CAG:379]